MKKLLTALAAIALFSLALVAIAVPGGHILSLPAAKAAQVPQLDLQNILKDALIPVVPIPTPTPKLVLKTEKPLYTRIPRPTPSLSPEPDKPTKKPENKPSSGKQYMTSEGPLFLSFRADLTDELYMFTPMDLAMDGEYRFPLIGSSLQVIGEAKVEVKSGMAIVTYLTVNGVKVDEKNEFFTFFPDIRGVSSVKPSQLQQVKLRFGIPYSVAGWLNSDSKVLLYINCPVSYKTDLKGLAPFAFEDPAYIQRVIEALALMD